YKLQPDVTCAAFEPVACDTFISESTFGLPIYRWGDPRHVFTDIAGWWTRNAEAGMASVLFCYAFGKAQRVLAGIRDAGALGTGPIITHGAIDPLTRAYRAAGVDLPATRTVHDVDKASGLRRALVIAPPSAAGTPWLRRFGALSDAFASGWMLL